MNNKAITSKITQQEKDIGDLKTNVKKMSEFSSIIQQQLLALNAEKILKEFPTFSHLMRKMARKQDYPTWEYQGFVEFFINDPDKRKALKDAQVLISFERDGREHWILGPAGIQIVNSWKANELNKGINTLTMWVIGLMILQIIVAIIILFIQQL